MPANALSAATIAGLQTLSEDIRANVQIIDGHALWLGPTITVNDGQSVYGRIVHENRQTYAHKLIFETLRSKQPGQLRRLCDQPLCVAPDHWTRPRDLWPDGKRPASNESDARFLKKLYRMIDDRLAQQETTAAR